MPFLHICLPSQNAKASQAADGRSHRHVPTWEAFKACLVYRHAGVATPASRNLFGHGCFAGFLFCGLGFSFDRWIDGGRPCGQSFYHSFYLFKALKDS